MKKQTLELTSSIWVGSRSVSIRCPKPSPSPPPLTFPFKKFMLSKILTLMIAVMAQRVLLQVVAAWKTLSTKSTLVFSLPSVNSEVPMQLIRPMEETGFKTSNPLSKVTCWTSWRILANCKGKAGRLCAIEGELSGGKSSCKSFHS